MLGHHREAVADADLALAGKPLGPTMMLNIACIFAQAAARVEADSEQMERKTLADGYRRHAVTAVRQTLGMVRPEERLAYWNEKVIKDPALAPVRDKNGLDEVKKELITLRPRGFQP